MGLFKPDPPTPPNPYQTAAAQTGTNVSTGVANAFLNNVNQVNPQGSLNYDVTGNYGWTDPSTGQTYQIPRFTATQQPTQAQRDIMDNNQASQFNLSQTGRDQSYNIRNLLNTPFNPTGSAPAGGNANAITNAPGAKTSFEGGGPIRMSLKGADDYGADRSRVEEALYARLNPQLAKERGNIEQRLADQGIRYGSQAYASAMDDYNRQANDARLGVTAQGGEEQQRLFNMGLGAGSFANAAQNQQFGQNAQQAGFYNQGIAQQLAQAQSGFNAQNAARNQYMQEQYQQRNQPMNEIAALLSGSQVQNPNWLNTPSSQIATTDIGGLINQNFAQQSQNYQSANQNWQSTMGGLLGLGAGALKMSDERVKENIVPMGTVFADRGDGKAKKLPISEWSYKGDPARHVGPMAQDVEKVDPGAVTEIGGVKHIDPKRVMGSILRAA
jgi:hypothetical protein